MHQSSNDHSADRDRRCGISPSASRCPDCGNESIRAGDRFCEACGRSLCESGSTTVGARCPACVECGGSLIGADGFCEQCGLLQPSSRDHVELEAGAMAGVSDRGLRHSRNEDAMAVTEAGEHVIAVVCDGVSSAPRPQDASQVAADTGVATLAARLATGAGPETATRAALAAAAKAVSALAESPHDAPACTYVSAVVGPQAVTVGWAGDSRAYWIRTGTEAHPSVALTVDDSWATQMVGMGLMTAAQAHADRRAHMVTAWLGADAQDVPARAETFEPDGPGMVVICSDGLWNYLPEAAELADAVHRAAGPAPAGRPPLQVARSLVRTALDAGGHDNVTVVLIPFPPQAGPENQAPDPNIPPAAGEARS